MSWKNYLKEWRETNRAMKNFLNTEINAIIEELAAWAINN